MNRDLFLPFIDLLTKKCIIHDINSGQDYRLSGQKTIQVYLTPITADTDNKLEELFTQLSHNEPAARDKVIVNGRAFHIDKAARNVAMFTFHSLCVLPVGAADYIELSKNYHTIIIRNIPKMTGTTTNEARRFITLIDVLYEHRVKLICSSEAPPNQLFELGNEPTGTIHIDEGIHAKLNHEQQKVFTGEEEKFMFARCRSRMEEMQTDMYLRSAHSPPT